MTNFRTKVINKNYNTSPRVESCGIPENAEKGKENTRKIRTKEDLYDK
jgi:hypothetical protein